MVLVTVTYPLLLATHATVEPGPLVAGYLGLLLLAAAVVACGLFLSALTDSQMVAGATTYGVLLFFWIITWNEAAVSEGALGTLRKLSLFDRFADLRPRRYRHRRRLLSAALHHRVPRIHLLRARRATLAGVPLVTPSRAVRGWAQLVLHVGLFVVGLGLLQVAAERTNRRIDLTPSRALSLSPVTRQVVAQVTAPMTITVFHRRGERRRLRRALAAAPPGEPERAR